MAVQEQVERLTRSIAEWNEWRLQQPHVRPDLFGVDLSHTTLSGAILSFADLRVADLSGANLSFATLSGAILDRANLSGATLIRADLSEATLSFASLIQTNLGFATLIRADLSGADLSFAHLIDTCLSGAILSNTNLSGADLRDTNLSKVHLSKAILTEVHFSYSTFAWIDLSDVTGLETAIHSGPSAVDIHSVVLPSDEHTRLQFLHGVGFSDTAIESLPSVLAPAAIQYYSLFIAYANPDDALARRLYRDLQDNGVRCWMAPHDLRPGDYHHIRIDEAIRLHEKVLLLLSEHAVNSSWVKHEVQVALAREVNQDCTVLFPLRLDQAVMETSKDWAAQLRETRHIGDFTNWQSDSAYREAFSTLLQHLKVTKP